MRDGKNMAFNHTLNLKKFSEIILIKQTIFALPFAYLGILFAGGGTVSQWILVTLALVAARTAGMCFNRAIDADIDARNPRTALRALPRGDVRRAEVLLAGAAASAILIVVSYFINGLCFGLSFAAVALLAAYSYFKRFSSTTHFFLGFVEAAAPIGGYLAVSGRFELNAFILGFAIMMWIAGLDIMYAVQDVSVDREQKLFSIPARFGEKKALQLSVVSYIFSIITLALLGYLTDHGRSFYISLICAAVIMIQQQRLIRREDTELSLKEIFTLNTFISPLLLAGTIADYLIK